MQKEAGEIISFEEFKNILAKELQLDPEKVVPEASFVENLFVDSIRMVELMLQLEQSGITIPVEAAWDVQTVGDAYRVYSEAQAGS